MTVLWTSLDTWIVLTAALAALPCALVGNYLVLRQESLMGDALSHAVLPGLAGAFLLTGSIDPIVMLIGALFTGLLTTFLVDALKRWGNVQGQAAMGVVFTALFALGLVMIRYAAERVDLDPDCVLTGALEYVILDTYAIAGWDVPRAALGGAIMLAVNVVFVVLFWKELRITSFDPALATTLGINATVMHYTLMALVAATVVAAFTSVGSILVIAMLVVPGATARQLTNRMAPLFVISLLVAGASAALGHWAAIAVPPALGYAEASSAGTIATVAGLIFTLTLMLGPRNGLALRVARKAALAMTVLREDILGLLYRASEDIDAPSVAPADITRALGGGVLPRIALRQLLRRGEVRHDPAGTLLLTPAGEQAARQLIRSHRLWENYLVDFAGVRPDHVHGTAERLEHLTDAELRERLASRQGSPRLDPHARAIPEAGTESAPAGAAKDGTDPKLG